MTNLVSVITPLYNSEKFISQAIESVLNQTYKNWEMIIIDDFSNDRSVDIVNKFIVNKKYKIKLIELDKNYGPAHARNVGIKNATGDYIAFLDSDDVWLPDKLEKQVRFMIDHDLGLSYSSYYVIDDNSRRISTRYILKKAILYDDMLKTNHIGNSTSMYHYKKYHKYYMRDINHEDYVFWLDLIQDVNIAMGIYKPLVEYRIHSGSVSAKKIKSAKWQWTVYRKFLKLNLLKSIYYFLYYTYYSIKKRL